MPATLKPSRAHRTTNASRIPRTPSSGNVFEDLGFDAEEAAVLTAKTDLMTALAKWAATYETQAAAAEALGVAQPRISAFRNLKTDGFSMDQLVRLAVRAGFAVEVRIGEHNPGYLYAEAC